jgi:uncharacterized membrane protein
MRVCSHIHVLAPPDRVWKLVSDPSRVLSFMSGVTRWEIASEQLDGVGARFRTLVRIGSADVGGLIEIVEWDPDRELAWTSVTGLDQRGRWRLREAPGGRTRVELRLAYGVAGSGIAGWIAEHVAAPTVNGHVRSSLLALKRLVEQEQRRERASARKRARAG